MTGEGLNGEADEIIPKASPRRRHFCTLCSQLVLSKEKITVNGRIIHKSCQDVSRMEMNKEKNPMNLDVICSKPDEVIDSIEELVLGGKSLKEKDNYNHCNVITAVDINEAVCEGEDSEVEIRVTPNTPTHDIGATGYNNEPDTEMNQTSENNGDAMKFKSNESKDYPVDLCPFGDEEDDIQKVNKVDDYDSSLNPFGSDDENETEARINCITPIPAPRKSLRQLLPSTNKEDSSVRKYNSSSVLEVKKRPYLPPPPPPKNRLSFPSLGNNVKVSPKPLASFLNQYGDNRSISNDTLSIESGSMTGSPDTSRKSALSSDRRSSLTPSDEDDSISTMSSNKTHKYVKKKKAPPIPVPKRTVVTGSMEDIQQELCNIADSLIKLQKRMDELVELFKNGGSHRQRRLITEYLALSQEKCSFARRQEELSYMKREHKLEEEHGDIEFKLRIIMTKLESMRTKQDDDNEKGYLQRLVEIIEERNEIVENIMRIDKRSEFNSLVGKLKKLKTDKIVNPILAEFMKTVYNEKDIKASEIKFKSGKIKRSNRKKV